MKKSILAVSSESFLMSSATYTVRKGFLEHSSIRNFSAYLNMLISHQDLPLHKIRKQIESTGTDTVGGGEEREIRI